MSGGSRYQRPLTGAILGMLAYLGPVTAQSTADTVRPNLVCLIVDDLGYGETGMMGNGEIPTPSIDRLAADGVRCTNGYVTSSYCSPSRAGILTGRYQSRFGYDLNPTGAANLHPVAGLPESETTFVQRLADAGYRTGLVGKWHLGSVASKQPLHRGFQSFFGFLHEGHFYVPGPPYADVLTMIRDRTLDSGQRIQQGDLIRGNYAAISEPAYDLDNPLIRGEQTLVEPEYLTDAITREAVDFIERHSDDPFCLVVAYNAVHSPMQARKSDLEAIRRITDPQRRIFAGMLIALDRGVGMIRQTLEAQGLSQRTMVVLLSDNGGPTEELTSSNAPLRGGKGSLYEGGVRVPMVWSYPGVIPAGQVEHRIVLSLDIAATALELAGVAADPALDGRSILSWMDDPIAPTPHETVFWRMSGDKLALRHGNWKIVKPSRDGSIELYHLAGDPSESRNLVSEQPEKTKDLINRWYALNAQMRRPIELPK